MTTPLSSDRTAELMKMVLAGEGPDPKWTKEELRFWNRFATEVAELPEGAVFDMPSEIH